MIAPGRIHEGDETKLGLIPLSGYALIITTITSAQACGHRVADPGKRRMSKAERKKAKIGDASAAIQPSAQDHAPAPLHTAVSESSSLSVVTRKMQDAAGQVIYRVQAPRSLLISYSESLRSIARD
jgi:hypothetical protein